MAKVGDKVPSDTLRTMGPEGPKAITTEEIFAPGKKVVAFALPGAFTPTCSAKHVPGFVAEAAALKAKGVDTIACISVNDAFVMGAWGKDQKAGDKVLMLGDGNGEFTQAMGLTMDGSKFGLGTRSQRYAMVVDNGVIKELFVEKHGAFKESAAEHVLEHLGYTSPARLDRRRDESPAVRFCADGLGTSGWPFHNILINRQPIGNATFAWSALQRASAC